MILASIPVITQPHRNEWENINRWIKTPLNGSSSRVHVSWNKILHSIKFTLILVVWSNQIVSYRIINIPRFPFHMRISPSCVTCVLLVLHKRIIKQHYWILAQWNEKKQKMICFTFSFIIDKTRIVWLPGFA